MKLAFIAGAGRSGSTLLERVLAQLGGVVALGEVTHLWERGLRQNQLCGCGRPFSECEHWQGILRASFGEVLPHSPDELVRIRNLAVSPAGMARLLSPHLESRARAWARGEYERLLAAVYRGAAAATGATVLVDSSKYPSDAYLIQGMPRPGIELYVLHMVRDSNAVVYSWRRRRFRPEIHWKREDMPRHAWWKTAGAWTTYNVLLDRFASDSRLDYRRVRYEDFVREPARVISEIAGFMGIGTPDLSFIENGQVTLDPDHTVSGNPVRFARGTVAIENDTEWRHDTPAARRFAVNVLTAWNRRKYGYP